MRREKERLRKADWRARRAQAVAEPPVSLTGLDSDLPSGKVIPAEKRDAAARLSLTGLVAELARMQGNLVRIVGQLGQG